MQAYVIGVGTTPFGRHPQRTHADLTREAVGAALRDAGLEAPAAVESIWFGACALHAWGQANIGGQVCLAPLVADHTLAPGAPVINVEGGCATGALAFQGALKDVLAGQAELSLAVGVEKTFFEGDPAKAFTLFGGALDQLDPDTWRSHYQAEAERAGLRFQPHPARIVLLDICSLTAQLHMQRHGTSAEQLAGIAAKNHTHGAQNPHAHHQRARSAEEILADKPVIEPFTRSMCAPLSDGAASVLVCSEGLLARLPAEVRQRAVKVAGCALGSGSYRPLDAPHAVEAVAQRAYARAGLTPDDVDLAEVHDATAFAELALTEALGFCEAGQGGAYAESGATRLGGARPVNPSGGLIAKGHPLSASGLAQLAELTTQLRGEAGARQVEGARVALAHNGGGLVGFDEATSVVTLLRRD